MSAPTSIQETIFIEVNKRPEYTALSEQIEEAFKEGHLIATEDLEKYDKKQHVPEIAQDVFCKMEAAKVKPAAANMQKSGDLITSKAPINGTIAPLIFLTVMLDTFKPGMTLKAVLNSATFLYQRGDTADAPAAPTATPTVPTAAPTSATSEAASAAGSSSSVIHIDDDDEAMPSPPPMARKRKNTIDAAVPSDSGGAYSIHSDTSKHASFVSFPVGGKAKMTDHQIFTNPQLKKTIKALKFATAEKTAVAEEIVDLLYLSNKEYLVQKIAKRKNIPVNQADSKADIIAVITEELVQGITNKINNGRV